VVRSIKRSEIERRRNAKTGIRIQNAKVKKRRIHITPRQVCLITLLLFVFMGSGIGYVWSTLEGNQIGYDLSRLREEEQRLKALNQKLRVELATLKSPHHLEEAAHRLGLRQASPEQIVILP
jgi:cell division protein FtsL